MKIYESVADYYGGKSVFITGGTGFLGKVLLEKLLYSCPDIEKIYVLIRDHKGLSADQRIKKLIDNPLFTRIKEQIPNCLKKLIPISGDISLPNLGIKPADEEVLTEKVSVVIHVAATVKFDEPLQVALKINVEGTRKILDLCHRMKNLDVFVHTSTAYCNTDKTVVEEIVYPPPAELDDVYAFLKDEEAQSRDILNGQPNTYTFTKAIAETLVERKHGNIPTIIVRPSIVTAISKDPLPGWVCNWNGATGILTAIAKGLTRAIFANPENILDLIPADYVANLVIAVAAKSDRSKNLAVYNCCSSDVNPVKTGDVVKQFVEETMKNKSHILPRPDLFILTQHQWLLVLITFVFQTLPAYIVDFWLLLRGKRTNYVKIQARLKQSRDIASYFTSHSWVMKTGGIRKLASSLSPADCRLFPCNPQDIHWREYISLYCAGIRQFLEEKCS